MNSINLQSHQFLLLHHSDDILFVEKGKMDLFFIEIDRIKEMETIEHLAKQAIPFEKKELENASSRFFRASTSGDLLFPFPLNLNGRYFVVLSPLEPVVLKKLPLNTALENRQQFNQQLNQWLHQFNFLSSSFSIEYVDIQGEANTIIEIPSGSTFTMSSKIDLENKFHFDWMEVIEGSLNLFQIEEITLHKKDLLYPVIRGFWSKSLAHSKVKLYHYDEVPFDSRCWHGLLEMNQVLLNVYAFLQLQLFEKEITKAHFRKKNSQLVYRHALNELQAVLNPRENIPHYDQKDWLFNICQFIGYELNLNFQKPGKPHPPSIEERIYQICFYSNIYYRKISLEENWWKSQAGPLLGFYGEEERPVALIQRNGYYRMIDLKEHTAPSVSSHIDKDLSCTAYQFYRSFPETALTRRDFFKFCRFKTLKPVTLFGLLGIAASLLTLLFPFANRIIFDLIIPNSEKSLLIQIVVGLILIAISSQVFIMIREYTLLRLNGLMEQDLEAAVFQRLFDLPLRIIRRFEFGDLLQRVFAIKTIRLTLSGRVLRLLFNSLFSFLYLIPMFYYSVFLTVIGLLVTLLNILFSIWGFLKNIKYQEKLLEIKSKANGLVLQFLAAISKIRVAGTEYASFADWEKTFYPSVKVNWQAQKINIWLVAINRLTPILATFVIFTTLILLIEKSYFINLTLGQFLAFNSAFTTFYLALVDFSNTLLEIPDLFPLWKKAAALYQEPPESEHGKLDPGILTGALKVDHIFFKYENATSYTIEDFSLYAEPGELIGIIGQSGCGKTTLVKLLIGLEIPESGAIYYDNQDINSLNIKFLRKQFGIVLQTNAMFDGTIRDNVVLDGFYSDEEVVKALVLAGFEEDLEQLPMGLQTIITNEGNNFSQGQKQRLLIARAIIGKPRILILDEATNALDSRNQEIIQQNLNRMNVTRIVIAHNLTTIRYADRIYVIEKGKVVDIGTFSELAARSGFFSEIVKKQKLI